MYVLEADSGLAAFFFHFSAINHCHNVIPKLKF